MDTLNKDVLVKVLKVCKHERKGELMWKVWRGRMREKGVGGGGSAEILVIKKWREGKQRIRREEGQTEKKSAKDDGCVVE